MNHNLSEGTPGTLVIAFITSFVTQINWNDVMLTLLIAIITTIISLFIKVIWDVLFRDKIKSWLKKFKRK